MKNVEDALKKNFSCDLLIHSCFRLIFPAQFVPSGETEALLTGCQLKCPVWSIVGRFSLHHLFSIFIILQTHPDPTLKIQTRNGEKKKNISCRLIRASQCSVWSIAPSAAPTFLFIHAFASTNIFYFLICCCHHCFASAWYWTNRQMLQNTLQPHILTYLSFFSQEQASWYTHYNFITPKSSLNHFDLQ